MVYAENTCKASMRIEEKLNKGATLLSTHTSNAKVNIILTNNGDGSKYEEVDYSLREKMPCLERFKLVSALFKYPRYLKNDSRVLQKKVTTHLI